MRAVEHLTTASNSAVAETNRGAIDTSGGAGDADTGSHPRGQGATFPGPVLISAICETSSTHHSEFLGVRLRSTQWSLSSAVENRLLPRMSYSL